MMLSLFFWGALALRIIAGTVLLAIGASFLARLAKRSATERWVWQGSIMVLGFFLVAEFGGFNVNDLVKTGGGTELNGAENNRGELRIVVREGEAGGASKDGPSPSGTEENRREASRAERGPVLWPAALWLAGTGVFFLVRLTQAGACFAVKRRSEKVNEGAVFEIVKRIARRLGLRRVGVYASRFYETPVAYGIFSASIGLPRNFAERFTEAEQEVILAHELAHLARRDALWRTVADLVCAVCWWNPFAWVLRRKFLGACELAADEASAEIGRGELLANVLVALAARMRRGLVANWSGMGGEYRSGLARRVTRLLEKRRTVAEQRAWWGGIVTRGLPVTLFFGGIVALQAVGGALYGEGDSGPVRMVYQSLSAANVRQELAGQEEMVEGTKASIPVAEMRKVEEATERFEEKLELPTSKLSEAEASVGEKAVITIPERSEEARSAVSAEKVETRVALADPEETKVGEKKAESEEPKELRAPQLRIEGKWAELKDLTLEQLREMGVEAEASGPDEVTGVKAWLIRMQPGIGWQTNDLPDAKISGPHRAVLAAVEYQELLDAIGGRPNTDILSAPRVTTVSGREVHISVADIQTLVTGVSTNLSAPKEEQNALVTEQMEFGTTLRLVATVLENGKIRVNLEGQAREFMGYDDPGKGGRVQTWQDGRKTKVNLPLPKIRERRYSTKTELKSGETVVLFGLAVPETRKFKDKVPVLGDIPALGRLFRNESEERFTKHLLLMITVEKLGE